MRRYVIERKIPGFQNNSNADYRAVAVRSGEVLAELGKDIQWVESYVVADRAFCVYLATDEAIIERHAAMSGFPADNIYEVHRIIDPTTAGVVARVRA
jgi:hypothetical protein